MLLTVFLAGALYLLATLHIAFQIRAGHADRRNVFLLAGFAAVVLHGVHSANTIYVDGAVNLGFLSAASLLGMIIALVAIIISLVRPVAILSVTAYPIAFTALLLYALLGSNHEPRTFSAGVGVHIVLSMLAYAVITMATAHAVLLAAKNRLFRQHRIEGLMRVLPPIQTMEAILFELVATGFVLLTAAIVAGLLYVDDFFAQHLIHKTALTLGSWVTLGVLLIGHRISGWRGDTAIRWMISTFVLLAIAFFGSKFVLEIILGRQ
ncbi:MAG: inner membrane protein YpjD [Gammaproteobacteria bacterium]